MKGLSCPHCTSERLRTIDSRKKEGTVLRKRECHDCGHRFTTTEQPVPVMIAPDE